MISAALFLRVTAISAIACLACSSWMKIENRIEPDAIADERLVGIWKIVHQAPEEIKDPEVARHDEGFGIYGPLVIGKSTDGNLIAVGIDRFRSDGTTLIGDFIVKTRNHKKKQFIVGDFVGRDGDRNESKGLYFVMEYGFNEGGDLFLWGMHDGLFDEGDKELPPLPHRLEKQKLGGELITITATPDELLDYLVDPKVSPHLLNCGKYRKMVLPEGNSPAFEEE